MSVAVGSPAPCIRKGHAQSIIRRGNGDAKRANGTEFVNVDAKPDA